MSSSSRGQGGFTLLELIVALAILAILSALAAPSIGVAVRTDKERELRQDLREIRGAIDAFHDDWQSGRTAKEGAASQDGYPISLDVLVAGVQLNTAAGGIRRYLRRIPVDPFTDGPWELRSYQDAPDADRWGGQDVYDVRSTSHEEAADGSQYSAW